MPSYDYDIVNSEQGKDITLNVNVGGTITKVLTAQGSTGKVIIPSLETSGGAIAGTTLAISSTASFFATNYAVLSISTNGTIPTTHDRIVISGSVTSLVLPSNVLAGRSLTLINTTNTAISLTASSLVLCQILPNSIVTVTALQNTPSTIYHWVLETNKKQREQGTSVTTNVNAASTTFANFSVTSILLTFTAAFSAKYKIHTALSVEQPTVASSTHSWGLRINPTVGSPTPVWTPNTAVNQNTLYTSNSALLVYTLVQRVDTLVAGTAYTYVLQGAASTNSVKARGDITEIALLAEMIE